MLDEIFLPSTPADKYKRASDERGGAASILVGIAANRCFQTGQPVKIADLAFEQHANVGADSAGADAPLSWDPSTGLLTVAPGPTDSINSRFGFFSAGKGQIGRIVFTARTLRIASNGDEVYFGLGETLHLKWLLQKIDELPVEGRWHAHARGVMRDEMQAQQGALVAQVLAQGSGTPEQRIAGWVGRDDPALRFTLSMFGDMRNQRSMDYPTMSVALRRLAQLVAAGTRG